MEENKSIEFELTEEIARPHDILVRRMTKVKPTDDRADRDLRHDAAKSLNGIDDAGVTAAGHKHPVVLSDAEVEDGIRKGEIIDAKTLAAWTCYRLASS